MTATAWAENASLKLDEVDVVHRPAHLGQQLPDRLDRGHQQPLGREPAHRLSDHPGHGREAEGIRLVGGMITTAAAPSFTPARSRR